MWSNRLIPAGLLLAALMLLPRGFSSAQAAGLPDRSGAAWNGRELAGSLTRSLSAELERISSRGDDQLRVAPAVGVGSVESATALAEGGGRAAPSSGVPDGMGGVIVVWEDLRRGETDIYAQRLNSSGVPQWTPNGVPVCAAEGAQSYPVLVTDGAGGVIVTWQDHRGGTDHDIYAQHVLTSGDVDPAWPGDGLALCAAASDQYDPTIASDDSGGAIVAWRDTRSQYGDIYAQRVSAGGVPQWTADGTAVCTAAYDQSEPALVENGAGGAIVTWMDERSSIPRVYAQWLSAGGMPQWPANGVAVSSSGEDQTHAALISDGAGGAIVAWAARYSDDSDIHAQHLNVAGVPQWTAVGVALCTATGSQSPTSIVSDGAGGTIVTWVDYRNGILTNNLDIYAQRVSAEGVPQWIVDGVAVCAAAGAQSLPTVVADGAGAAIFAWSDHRGDSYDIYAQQVSASGVPQWTADGVAVYSDLEDQMYPMLIADGAGGAIVSWKDQRSHLDLDAYAQRLSGAGTLLWAADGVPVHVEPGVQVAPVCARSPGGGAIVAWIEKREGDYDLFARKFDATGASSWSTVPICTAAGAQARPRIAADGAGGAIVTWEDRRSGSWDVYAQRVSADGLTQWAADGLAMCATSSDQNYPKLVSDASGGAIVAWEDQRGGVYAQRVSADGVVQWQADGVLVGTDLNRGFFDWLELEDAAFALEADEGGGAIVAWQKGSTYLYIYAQRVNGAGVVVWTADGVLLSAIASDQYYPALVSDGQGGAIVAWGEFRKSYYEGIGAQRVSAEGVRQWTAIGMRAYSGGGADHPALVADGAGGAIVTWEDNRTVGYWGRGAHIYAQRMSATGVAQWTATGVAVCTAGDWQLAPTLVADGTGGAIVSWDDYRGNAEDYGYRGDSHQVYAQRVSAGGIPQWTIDGLQVREAATWQSSPALVSDGAGGTIVTWLDWRDGNGSYLYTQRLNANGAAEWSPDGVTAVLASFLTARVFDQTVQLSWYLNADEPSTVTVYRRTLKGPWRSLGTVTPDGTGYVRYEDTGLISGTRYGYRLGIKSATEPEVFAGEAWVDLPLSAIDLAVHVPNPIVSGDVTVSFAAPAGRSVRIDLFDMAGRTIASQTVAGGTGRRSLSLARASDLAPGRVPGARGAREAVVARVAVLR